MKKKRMLFLAMLCALSLLLCGCGSRSSNNSSSSASGGDTADSSRNSGGSSLADTLRDNATASSGADSNTGSSAGSSAASSNTGESSSVAGDNASVQASDGETIRVSDLEGFIAAIGPDRTVILEGSGILLVETDARSETGFAPMPDTSANPYVYWHPMGEALVIEGVENLTIRGGGWNRFSLTSDSEWSPLINFFECRNITMENISAGHTVGSTCATPVFGIGGSEDITLRNCGLYGCGAVGLFVFEAQSLTVEDSDIYDCSERLVDIEYATDIVFRRVNFYDTKGSRHIRLESSKNILFEDCVFRANYVEDYSASGGLFFAEGSVSDVTVRRCEFIGNAVNVLDESGIVRFENCSFDDNGFDNYGAVESGVWVQMIEPWLDAPRNDFYGEYYGEDEYFWYWGGDYNEGDIALAEYVLNTAGSAYAAVMDYGMQLYVTGEVTNFSDGDVGRDVVLVRLTDGPDDEIEALYTVVEDGSIYMYNGETELWDLCD